MTQSLNLILVLTILVHLTHTLSVHPQHSFVAFESTYLVSRSPSLKKMYACKDECMKMKTVFPFELKYHRLVMSQTQSNKKYLEGHCYVKMEKNGKTDWVVWSNLLTKINANTKDLSSWL